MFVELVPISSGIRPSGNQIELIDIYKCNISNLPKINYRFYILVDFDELGANMGSSRLSVVKVFPSTGVRTPDGLGAIRTIISCEPEGLQMNILKEYFT